MMYWVRHTLIHSSPPVSHSYGDRFRKRIFIALLMQAHFMFFIHYPVDVFLSRPHFQNPETWLGRGQKEEPGFLGKSPREMYLDQESRY